MELRWRISLVRNAGAAVVNKGDKTWLINGEAKQDCERMPYLNLTSPVII